MKLLDENGINQGRTGVAFACTPQEAYKVEEKELPRYLSFFFLLKIFKFTLLKYIIYLNPE
jgi:hypothetical protein